MDGLSGFPHLIEYLKGLKLIDVKQKDDILY